eukprot:Gb_18074 [translate_table: standard]
MQGIRALCESIEIPARRFVVMGWCKEKAMNAYLDTIKLCKLDHERRCGSTWNPDLRSSEFVSAMAAGMNSQIMVEVRSSSAGTRSSTIALAAAATHTGGHLTCFVPCSESLSESVECMDSLGLGGVVEFVVGEAIHLLSDYENIDFALIDCKNDKDAGVFEVLNLNPARAVVISSNVSERKSRIRRYGRGLRRAGAKSSTHHIGKSLEVTRISSSSSSFIDVLPRNNISSPPPQPLDITDKCCYTQRRNWIVAIDEMTGEEHVFRVPRNMPISRYKLNDII